MGESLLPAKDCNKPKFSIGSGPEGVGAPIAVFYKGYKLVYYSKIGARELYDLKTDPEEQFNVLDKEINIRNTLTNFVLQGLFYEHPKWISLSQEVKWVEPSVELLGSEPITIQTVYANSSATGHGEQMLIDGREDTYWHRASTKGYIFPNRSCIQVNLETPQTIKVLGIKPRLGEPQMWGVKIPYLVEAMITKIGHR
jgi:hypothetical protein